MKKITPLLGKVLKKIAPKLGAKVLDINTLGASEIAKDKDYATYFMKHLGYPTVPGKAFYSNDWANAIGSNNKIDEAYDHASKMGFPVIVKPNSMSQGF